MNKVKLSWTKDTPMLNNNDIIKKKSLIQPLLYNQVNNDSYHERYLDKNSAHHDRLQVYTCQDYYENGEAKEGRQKRCFWCLKDFEGEGEGIPVKMDMINQKPLFYIIDKGCYCSMQCVYADVKSRCILPVHYIQMYEKVLNYIKIYHSYMYPGKELLATNDPRLLRCFGGPLRKEEFDNMHYNATKNIIYSQKINIKDNTCYVYGKREYATIIKQAK